MRLFRLGEAYQEVKDSKGALETSLSIGFLLGKTVLNTGMIVVDEMAKKGKLNANMIIADEKSSPELVEKAEKVAEKSKKWDFERKTAEINGALEDARSNLRKWETTLKRLYDKTNDDSTRSSKIDEVLNKKIFFESEVARLTYEKNNLAE